MRTRSSLMSWRRRLLSSTAGAGSPPPEAVQRTRQVLAAGGSWEDLWTHKLTPWDLQGPTPALVEALGALPTRLSGREGLRVLVPGCGSGHDLVALAEGLGSARVVGLDLSPTSTAAAGDTLARAGLAPGEPHPTTGSVVDLATRDFFAFTPAAPFDLIFDYTFFCALPPALRGAWGRQTAALLARPSGALLTLMFPLESDADGTDPTAAGPPFPVSVPAYTAALTPHGLALEPGSPRETPATVEPRRGRELVAWWGWDSKK